MPVCPTPDTLRLRVGLEGWVVSMSDHMISVRGLCKSYGDAVVLKDVDVDVDRGDVISIIGPSGCGKSTLLRCLNYLDPPTSGQIWFDGEKVSADPEGLQLLRRKMGMVFQSFNLFSNMTVLENVMLAPVHVLGASRQEAYDQAMNLLETVGLAHKALSYAEELSGGQKQRVAIARALAMRPEAVLFDEPTSALDPTMVAEVLGVMKVLADRGTTMLIVTHEMNFARTVSNRILYLDEQGIYEDGTPKQVFENPRRPRTRDFIFNVRSFTYPIHPRSFDFYELLGRVCLYMRRQLFDDARITRATHVLDEAVNHCVLLAGPDVLTQLTMRYTAATDELVIEFRDPAGAAHYPFEEMDELSRRVLEGYATTVQSLPASLLIKM